MLKNLLAIITLAVLLSSCGSNTGEKKNESTADEAVASIAFASLIETPAAYLEKDISLDGKVVHVCTHSGKKMFIVGENPDIRLFITSGDEVPKFPMELLGSTISVSGHLTMVDVGEEKGEGEHKEGEEKEHKEGTEEAPEGEDCATETAVAAQPVLADYVLQYASHIVK